MKKQKMLPVRAAEMNEDLFLAMISAKSEANAKAHQLAQAEEKLHLSQMARRQEHRAAQKKLDGMVAFIGVMVGLVVSGVCVLAAPVWTAALPAAGMLAVMRKAGWI